MAQVSQRKITKEEWIKVWRFLVLIVGKQNNPKQVKSLLLGLFTSTEKVMMAKRLMASYLLVKGWSIRQVSECLKLSTSTVTSLKRQLRYQRGFKQLLEQYTVQMENKSTVKTGIEKLLEDIFVGRTKRSRLLFDEPIDNGKVY